MKKIKKNNNSYLKEFVKLLKIMIAIVLIVAIFHYESTIDWERIMDQLKYEIAKLFMYSAFGFIAGILILDIDVSKEKIFTTSNIIGFAIVLLLALWDVLYARFAYISFVPEFMYEYCVGTAIPFQLILGVGLAILIKKIIFRSRKK